MPQPLWERLEINVYRLMCYSQFLDIKAAEGSALRVLDPAVICDAIRKLMKIAMDRLTGTAVDLLIRVPMEMIDKDGLKM